MSAASLVVKISADINDFSRKLETMTSGVEKASKKIEKFGEALTIATSVEVAALTAELAKLGAEAEDVGARFDRVFGSMAGEVKQTIEGMTKTVPATVTEMEGLATSLDNALKAMEIGPAKAGEMSQSMLKLAGDVAAFNRVPFAEALDALQRGLEGRTRGLINFGIAIKEADVKQEAYRLGILHTGNELTTAGTALATYSLLMKRTGEIQGEAARTVDQNSKQFEFFKRDLHELGEELGGLVLPTVANFIRGLRDVVEILRGVDGGTARFVLGATAVVAALGPTIVMVVKVVNAMFQLRAAFTLLSAGGSIAGFFAAIATPVGWVVAGIIALTAALGGLYLLWKKFHKSDADTVTKTPEDIAGATTKLTATTGKGAGTGALERSTKDPLGQFKQHAEEITKGFDNALAHGKPVQGMMTSINELHSQAARLVRQQGSAFTETAAAAQQVLDKVESIKNGVELAAAKTPEEQQKVLTRIARDQKNYFDAVGTAAQQVADETMKKARDLEVRFAKMQIAPIGNKMQNGTEANPQAFEAMVKSLEDSRARTEALNLREALLKLPDGFDAAREALVEFGEAQRGYAEDIQKRLLTSAQPSFFNAPAEARIKSNEQVKSAADDLALREELLKLPDGFNAARTAAVEFAESQRQVTEATALEYEKLKLALGAFGIHIGSLSPVMQGVALSLVQTVTSFAQSLAGKISGGGPVAGFLGNIGGNIVGSIIGKKLGGIGGSILGPIGIAAGTIVGGLVGGLFDHHKKVVDQANTSMDTLRKTVDKLNESFSNVPSWYKVAIARFDATPAVLPAPSPPPPTTPPSNNPSPGSGSTPPPTDGGHSGDPTEGANGNVVNIHGPIYVQGVTDLKSLHAKLIDIARQQRSTGNAASLAFAGSMGVK